MNPATPHGDGELETELVSGQRLKQQPGKDWICSPHSMWGSGVGAGGPGWSRMAEKSTNCSKEKPLGVFWEEKERREKFGKVGGWEGMHKSGRKNTEG